MFLRLPASIAATDTFKQRKAPLVREGFDPALVDDPPFVDDREAGASVPLDLAMVQRVLSGRLRL